MLQNCGNPWFGNRSYTDVLGALGLVRLPDGTLFVSRTGRGDVARVTLGPGTLPSVCPIAGTGRRGTAVGEVTEMPLPTALTPGPEGVLFVSDATNGRVLRLRRPP